MYLYLGKETVIRTDEIVGIFDLDNTSVSKLTKAYLARAQKEFQVVTVSSDLPKSYVVCKKGDRQIVYLSQISPSTLRKRAAGRGKDIEMIR